MEFNSQDFSSDHNACIEGRTIHVVGSQSVDPFSSANIHPIDEPNSLSQVVILLPLVLDSSKVLLCYHLLLVWIGTSYMHACD